MPITRKKCTRLEVVAVVTVKVDIRHVNAYQPRNTRLLLSSGGALLFPHQHPRYVLPLRLLLQPVGLVLSEGAYSSEGDRGWRARAGGGGGDRRPQQEEAGNTVHYRQRPTLATALISLSR